jgi:hypothetical protein
MLLTILNLHYIRRYSCKCDLFWLSGSGEEDSKMIQPHFCILFRLSPLSRGPDPLFEEFLYPKMIYTKVDCQWLWRRRLLNEPTPFLHFKE